MNYNLDGPVDADVESSATPMQGPQTVVDLHTTLLEVDASRYKWTHWSMDGDLRVRWVARPSNQFVMVRPHLRAQYYEEIKPPIELLCPAFEKLYRSSD